LPFIALIHVSLGPVQQYVDLGGHCCYDYGQFGAYLPTYQL